MEPGEIELRLLELARLRRDTASANALLDAQIKPLMEARLSNLAALEGAEQALRRDLMAYMSASGDLHAHPAVHFQRRRKLAYDAEAVLMTAEDIDYAPLLRQKVELNRAALDKLYRAGSLPTALSLLIEDVPDPVIAIDKLGDLLIAAGEETN